MSRLWLLIALVAVLPSVFAGALFELARGGAGELERHVQELGRASADASPAPVVFARRLDVLVSYKLRDRHEVSPAVEQITDVCAAEIVRPKVLHPRRNGEAADDLPERFVAERAQGTHHTAASAEVAEQGTGVIAPQSDPGVNRSARPRRDGHLPLEIALSDDADRGADHPFAGEREELGASKTRAIEKGEDHRVAGAVSPWEGAAGGEEGGELAALDGASRGHARPTNAGQVHGLEVGRMAHEAGAASRQKDASKRRPVATAVRRAVVVHQPGTDREHRRRPEVMPREGLERRAEQRGDFPQATELSGARTRAQRREIQKRRIDGHFGRNRRQRGRRHETEGLIGHAITLAESHTITKSTALMVSAIARSKMTRARPLRKRMARSRGVDPMDQIALLKAVSKAFPSGFGAAFYCPRCGQATPIEDWDRLSKAAEGEGRLFTPAAAFAVVAFGGAHADHGFILYRGTLAKWAGLGRELVGSCEAGDRCDRLAYLTRRGRPFCTWHMMLDLGAVSTIQVDLHETIAKVERAAWRDEMRAGALDLVRDAVGELAEDLAVELTLVGDVGSRGRGEIKRLEGGFHA